MTHFFCQSLLTRTHQYLCQTIRSDRPADSRLLELSCTSLQAGYINSRKIREMDSYWSPCTAQIFMPPKQTPKQNKQDYTHYIKSLPVRLDVEPFLLRLGLKIPSCMSTPLPTPPLSTWIVFGRGREPVDVLFRILGTGFVDARSTLSGRSLPYIRVNIYYFAIHSNTVTFMLRLHCH